MDMSSACTAPNQPAVTTTDETHPRYIEYRQYRAAMVRQLVTGLSFSSWLQSTMEKENGREVIFQVFAGAPLPPGWYKHKFAPHTGRMSRLGPFASVALAQSA